jgi:hypothetical protein
MIRHGLVAKSTLAPNLAGSGLCAARHKLLEQTRTLYQLGEERCRRSLYRIHREGTSGGSKGGGSGFPQIWSCFSFPQGISGRGLVVGDGRGKLRVQRWEILRGGNSKHCHGETTTKASLKSSLFVG